MKRSGVIFLSAALLCGLCGCNTNNVEIEQTESQQVLSVTETYETEGTTVSEETEASVEMVTESEMEINEPDESVMHDEEISYEEQRIKSFVDYLESGGEKEFTYYDQGNRIDVYDFMIDFRVEKCSYTQRDDGIYDLTITCSESNCEMFPVGDSRWIFDGGLFYPAEKEGKIILPWEMYDLDETLRTAFWAAETFSLWTDVYEADEAWFDTYEHTNPHDFYHAYNPYMEADELGGVTVEEHIRATKQLYNITIPESAFDYLFERGLAENGKVFSGCGHGGTWNYSALAGYEETDEELKVTVDFYGDELYFYPVIESEYTFSKNNDGTITLQRVEKLFDRGYEPAIGSV
ncbi:MAG: hypothetical protein J1F11_00725 [Oscillospiraceae bacterium]|nr:hypothetical protein [Oscillospiraceae bacterium]